MNKVLLLRLAGPMQSWGSSSRFTRRNTDHAPTKSGVIGLLAAAKGLRRTDPLEELLSLRFGTRIDQQGKLLRDFQTARSLDDKHRMPLSNRYYWTDAVFLAAVQGNESLIQSLHEALHRPTFPLYLGRRSCPPVGPLVIGIRNGPLEEALASEPWQASAHYQRTMRSPTVHLEVLTDAKAGDKGADSRDVPLSFDPRRREYGWRCVATNRIAVPNPSFKEADSHRLYHDPFAAI